MKYFDWDKEKNERLKREREICFEDVMQIVNEGRELARIKHPNTKRYPNQRILIVAIADYAYIVPFVEDEEKIFLKTIIPSRKMTKKIFKEDIIMKYYELTKEEQELLEEVENGEWTSVPNFEEEKKRFQQIARNTLSKLRNINIRLSEKDLLKLKRKAAEDGIPYQTLASSVLHRFANQ